MCLCRLAEAYKWLGQDEEAVKWYEKTLSIVMQTRSIMPLILASEVMKIYGRRGQVDMVASTFRRIMESLASLEIDEESQAWALVGGSGENLSMIYQAFHDAHHALGKEVEFPNIARESLTGLLKGVSSRPQMAWYHTKLMELNLELGNMNSARNHAKEVTSIVEEMGSPDCMTNFYPAYLFLSNNLAAEQLAYRFLDRSIRGVNCHLTEVELAYRSYGQAQAFNQLCEKLELQREAELRDAGVNQICLKSMEHPSDFAVLEFEDRFDSASLLTFWEWIDPEGASSYLLRRNPNCIEILASVDSLLGYGSSSAPRLFQSISGNFAIGTRMGGQKLGGLFVRKDSNIVTLQRILWFFKPIVLTNQRLLAGRGLLDAESLILRLERKGNLFCAYCSDGEQWYSCGWTECEMEDPVQVGIFASCPRDAPQATTSFDYFRIYRE